MSSCILEARNLYKTYNHQFKKLSVLRDIKLSIKKNEVVCIMGPSGAGKSTLLHLLGGLDSPSRGDVFIDGENIYKLHPDKLAALRNSKIGFVFQFYHLFSEFNALENVLLPAIINKDFSLREADKKARGLLIAVGLGKRLNHKPNQLSGGEQQRVVIARALINDPEILFCDEPTGNLDSETGRCILDVLIRLNKEKAMTQVLVTHNRQISQVCSRIINIKDGEII